MNTPFMGFSPELLARLAQNAFRPPQGMGGGAPGLMAPPQTPPGFNVGDGMAGLGMGLAGFRKPPGWVPTSSGSEPGRTTGDADLGGYGASPADPMAGNPNAVPQIFNPTGAQSGGGIFDFLTGLFTKR